MASAGHDLIFDRAHFGLVSLHDKGSIIGPLLADRWQARLTCSTDFDTDSLGTFAGDVERQLAPVDCALHKARTALALTGADYGLGSEGSFVPAPWGFGVINQELIACVPASGNWAVVGRYTAPVAVSECRFGEQDALNRLWINLPDGQGVILADGTRVAKGIRSQAEAMKQLRQWYGGQIPPDLRIAYDLRAHQSPIRRHNIACAVEDLCARLSSCCTACGQPGFWPDQTITGLPCSDCGCPTNSAKARIARCGGCGHHIVQAVEALVADPASCPLCNP